MADDSDDSAPGANDAKAKPSSGQGLIPWLRGLFASGEGDYDADGDGDDPLGYSQVFPGSDKELYMVPNPKGAGNIIMGRGAFGLGNGTLGSPPTNRTMLITTLSTMFDVDLAPHFIRHFQSLGIRARDFLVILHAPDKGQDSAEVHARLIYYQTMLKLYNVQPVHTWFGDFRTDIKWRQMLSVLYNHTWIGDWIVHADSDGERNPI